MKSDMSNIWSKVIIACLLGLLLYAGIFTYALHSDSFKFVEQTIKNSRNVEALVGNVRSVNLSLLGSFEEKYVNSDEIATMTIKIKGSKKSATVDVKAIYKSGVWKVDGAAIEGAPFVID